MNIAILLEYDGTAFYGSQVQPGRRTVGGVIKDVLTQLEPERPGTLIMAGRTDAGVHALGQVGNFETSRDWSAGDWCYRLNELLPADCVVRQAWEVEAGFHARRDATLRRYLFRALTGAIRPAVGAELAGWWRGPLAVEAAMEAVALFEGRHNVAGLVVGPAAPPVRTIDLATMSISGEEWRFEFQARSFLQRQVRMMVGAVMQVASGRLKIEDIRRVIRTGERDERISAAPASGLYLIEVGYPPGVALNEGKGS